jgi:hypothetical protein
MTSGLPQPPAFVELLQECIESFDELEVVLALMRHQERTATTVELAAELRWAEPGVVTAVNRLLRAGLLRFVPPTVILDPSDPRRVIGLQQLIAEYETNRTRIMSLMTENALNRVRTSALRAFARAFVLRNKDDG